MEIFSEDEEAEKKEGKVSIFFWKRKKNKLKENTLTQVLKKR